MQVRDFQKLIWDYYHAHKRPMPWRDQPTPYYVVVSELMLQQTQVPRVLPKFTEFTTRFPDFASLASASLGDVLAAWSGLGYNRRAKFLWQLAQQVRGELPAAVEALTQLPGIGPNTAGAIMAYVYNQPVVFVETNIRTVFIHHFFADHPADVTDAQIRELVTKTLPSDNPREWYWALMDYGTHLKATNGRRVTKVHNYKPQSTFAGSRRQVRGQVLKLLVGSVVLSTSELQTVITDERLSGVLEDLAKEQLISGNMAGWHLT
jgi:A/G-specific adenine glycosylase